MDLPTEIILEIIKYLDPLCVNKLLQVNHSWRGIITSSDAWLFQTHSLKHKHEKRVVPKLNSSCKRYFNRVLYFYTLEKRLGEPGIVKNRIEGSWTPDVLWRDSLKCGTTMLAWKAGEEHLGVRRVKQTIPLFVLKDKASMPAGFNRYDLMEQRQLHKSGSIDLRNMTVRFTDVPPRNSGQKFDDPNLRVLDEPPPIRHISKETIKIKSPWGRIDVWCSHRDYLGWITVFDSDGKELHKLEPEMDSEIKSLKYTNNDLLIMVTWDFVAWYEFSPDGKQVSELRLQQTWTFGKDEYGPEKLDWTRYSLKLAENHMLISEFKKISIKDEKTGKMNVVESVNLYTCTYESIAENGHIRNEWVQDVCKYSDYDWHGPYTCFLPQRLVYHAVFEGVKALFWCLDMLTREAITYHFDTAEAVYLTEDFKFFSLTQQKMFELSNEYEEIRTKQGLKMGKSIPLADFESICIV